MVSNRKPATLSTRITCAGDGGSYARARGGGGVIMESVAAARRYTRRPNGEGSWNPTIEQRAGGIDEARPAAAAVNTKMTTTALARVDRNMFASVGPALSLEHAARLERREGRRSALRRFRLGGENPRLECTPARPR